MRQIQILSWLLAFGVGLPAFAQVSPFSGFTMVAYGSATIDGVMSREWVGAAKRDFDVKVPEGGTVRGQLLAMNDATTFYVAVKIEDRTKLGRDDFYLGFYRNPNRLRENGDDWIMTSVEFTPDFSKFADGFYGNRKGCPLPNVPGACAYPDAVDSGSVDGQGAVSINGTFMFMEMSHPLKSVDAKHDMQAGPGDKLRFDAEVDLCIATACGVTHIDFGEILLAAAGPALLATPGKVVFPVTRINNTSDPVTVTLINSGSSPVSFSRISVDPPFTLTRQSRNQTGSESRKLEPPSNIVPRPVNIC